MSDSPTTPKPRPSVDRAKIILVRLALSWALLVCVMFLGAFPLLRRAAPAGFPWRGFVVTLGYVVVSVFGIVKISRQPRDVAGVLAAAVTVNALSSLNLLKWLSPRRTWPGPAATVGALIALSLLLAFVLALVTAWRAHTNVGDSAI